jgi:hypothetical protein
MKAIGRGNTLSNPRLWLALVTAGMMIILLASLVLLTGSAHARANLGCADPNGCLDSRLTPLNLAGMLVEQSAKAVMAASGMGVYSTPMPASFISETNLPVADQGDQPLAVGLFLIIFGIAGTILAVGPLVFAALLDIRSTRGP